MTFFISLNSSKPEYRFRNMGEDLFSDFKPYYTLEKTRPSLYKYRAIEQNSRNVGNL